MADIAQIGFKADTRELADAKTKLDALSPAAEKAERASVQLAEGMNKSNRASALMASGFSKLRAAILPVIAAFAAMFAGGAILAGMSRTAQEIDAIAKQARKMGETTAGMQSLAVAADMAGSSFEEAASATQRMTITLARLERSGKGSEGVFKTLGISARELLNMPLNERLATIADRIKSLGMSSEDILPILAQLGDRQGALVNLFEGGGDQIREAASMMERFGGTISDLDASKVEYMNDAFSAIGVALQAMMTQIVVAFAPLMGPIFAGIAEGIGYVASGLKSLLDGTSWLIPILQEGAIALGIMFSPIIVATIWSMVTASAALAVSIGVGLAQAIYGAAAAMAVFALANPFTAIILAISTVLAAAYVFRDAIKRIFGIDIIASAKAGANAIISTMVGAYNGIMATWSMLPAAMGDVAIQAANRVVTTIQVMARNVIQNINNMLSSISGSMQGTMFEFTAPQIDTKKTLGAYKSWEMDNPNAGAASEAGAAFKKSMDDAFKTDWVGQFNASLDATSSALGNATIAAGGTAAAIDGVGSAAGGEGGTGSKGGGGAAEKLTELQQIANDFAKLSEPFTQAVSAYDAAENALANGIITNDEYASSLQRIQDAFLATGGTAAQWGKVIGAETDTVASKMKDLAENALSRLGDEFINLAVDGKASFADLAKSIIKDLLKILWQAAVVGPIMKMFGFSSGAAFSGGASITAFAKGGSFTNSIVDQPTPFTFAKGGALGVMGEAGPEAIMPLERGPDGSLGVSMYGAGGQSAPVNNNVEVTNVYRIEGAISEDKIVAQIRQGGEETAKQVRKSVVGWLNEYTQDGALV